MNKKQEPIEPKDVFMEIKDIIDDFSSQHELEDANLYFWDKEKIEEISKKRTEIPVHTPPPPVKHQNTHVEIKIIDHMNSLEQEFILQHKEQIAKLNFNNTHFHSWALDKEPGTIMRLMKLMRDYKKKYKT